MLSDRQKRLSVICGIILLVLGLCYGTIYALCKIYLDPQKIREIIISQAQKKLNRTVSVGEQINLHVGWNMSPHITLYKIAIGNSTWATKPNILTIDELELHLSLAHILFKRVDITSISLIKPAFYLESNGEQNNWDFLKELLAGSGGDIKFTVNQVYIEQGVVQYNGDTLLLDTFDFTAHDNNTNFHVHFHGKHNDMPIKTSFNIKNTDKRFNLDLPNLQAGRSDLSGELTINNDPMNVSGNFHSDRLVIKDFILENPNPSGEYSVPNNEIPVDKLRNSKFDVSAEFNTLELGGLNLNKLRVEAKNEKNIITFKFTPPPTVAGGKLNLTITYDLNPPTPTFSLEAKTAQIKLATVMEQMFKKSPINGSSLDFSASLQGQGTSFNAIVASMQGQILAIAGPGTFINGNDALGSIFTNVINSVMSYDKRQSTSDFKCGVMNFKVADGIARANSGIGIEGANVNVLGDGMVDLRNGRIAFSMVPQTFIPNPLDLSNFSVGQLVAIKGTVSKPELTLNTSNLIRQGAGALITAGLAGSTGGLAPVIMGGAAAAGIAGQSKGFVNPCQKALAQ